MGTVHNHPSKERFAEVDRQLEANIEKFGWTFMGVFGTEDQPITNFVYTIGLTEKGMPEVFVSGNFAPQSMQSIAGTVAQEFADHALAGTEPELGEREDLFNLKVELRVVHDTDKCNIARKFYGDRVRVVQVIWSDKEGRLPGEEGYDFEKFPQEILPAVQ